MHRVLTLSPNGEWSQQYEGTRRGCQLFISHMRASDRKRRSPIITRRSLEQWLEQGK